MKILFWTVILLGLAWYFMKKTVGQGNDLTSHLEEQKALRSIGDSALGANQISTGNWPLTTLGATPFAGIGVDPVNPKNPFTKPVATSFMPGTPSSPDKNAFQGFTLN